MIVIGIDPGFMRLGVSAVRSEGIKLELIERGIIFNKKDSSYNEFLNKGIENIVDEFSSLIVDVNPDFIYSELVPPGKLGMNSELVVAAITICKVIAIQKEIKWNDIAASTVKKYIAGDHIANKTKVRNAVLEVFPELKEEHKELKRIQKESGEKMIGLYQDLFDSVAISLTGLNQQEQNGNKEV